MRGKAHLAVDNDGAGGITPAHAGKRAEASVFRGCCRDHPRPCGEKQCIVGIPWCLGGSPPPMRGKAYGILPPHLTFRITPAHAGKSNAASRSQARQKDHPRPCGEKTLPINIINIILGSPPPMRGKDPLRFCVPPRRRITPAHAGKRRRLTSHDNRWQDHPRPCGEKITIMGDKL